MEHCHSPIGQVLAPLQFTPTDFRTTSHARNPYYILQLMCVAECRHQIHDSFLAEMSCMVQTNFALMIRAGLLVSTSGSWSWTNMYTVN